VDHEQAAGAPVRPIIGIREPGIDREIIIGVRIHQAGGDGVEAFGSLSVAFPELGPELARPTADREGVKESEPSRVVLFPHLELRLLLEDAQQDRRALLHVLGFDLGQYRFRQWLHVPPAGGRHAAGIAARKRRRRCDRSRR